MTSVHSGIMTGSFSIGTLQGRCFAPSASISTTSASCSTSCKNTGSGMLIFLTDFSAIFCPSVSDFLAFSQSVPMTAIWSDFQRLLTSSIFHARISSGGVCKCVLVVTITFFPSSLKISASAYMVVVLPPPPTSEMTLLSLSANFSSPRVFLVHLLQVFSRFSRCWL